MPTSDGLPRNANGSLEVKLAVPYVWDRIAGWPIDPVSGAIVVTNSPGPWRGGFRLLDDGVSGLCIDFTGVVGVNAHWDTGFVRDDVNKFLCIADEAAGPNSWWGGFMRDALGKLAIQFI